MAEPADNEDTNQTAEVKEEIQPDNQPAENTLSPESQVEPVANPKPSFRGRIKGWGQKYWARKRLTIPASVILLVALLALIPFTRYGLAGVVVKKDFAVLVLDNTTQKPVSNANVSIGSATVLTNNKGQARIHVKVGNGSLTVSKKYYEPLNSKVLVPFSQKNVPRRVSITASGRQVPVTVVDKFSGKPVEDATIKVAETTAKTDKNGKATLVVPAGKTKLDATVSSDGYNNTATTLEVTDQVAPANTFQLVPAGKVYFLSKLSGKIDVVKTNLDGTGRQTVLAGTGNEDDTDTILLASKDWKYLGLKSKRDGGDNAKLFLIATSNDKLTTIDEGNADFSLVGWSGHRFVFQVQRKGYNSWQPKAQALKSFNAETGKLAVLDETDAQGTGSYDYAYDFFSTVSIVDDSVVYDKNWTANYYNPSVLDGKQVSLVSVKIDGSSHKDIKDFPVTSGSSYYAVNLSPYGPGAIYVQVPSGSTNTYYEYEDGSLTAKPDLTDAKFYQGYPTYLSSPSDKSTFWAEPRDGKNTLFVGDAGGQNGKQIATLSDYKPYGWYTENYLLVSKNSSELYVMSANGGTAFKITDYHKPDASFNGYGGGYGGL